MKVFGAANHTRESYPESYPRIIPPNHTSSQTFPSGHGLNGNSHIYPAPRSKSNIHDNFVPVNVIALSASDRPAKRQLSPKMQNACSSTHTHHMHQTAPPKGSWVQKCKRVWSATTTSHGVCKPWSQMLATAVLAPVLHRWPCSARCLSPIHALHPPKTRPKYERLQRASPALARPPHLEQASLHMPHTTCFPPRLLPW